MVYYGWVVESVSDFDGVYKILQNALKLMPEEYPFRGPEKFEEGNFRYENKWDGGVERFSGEEAIFQGDVEIYRAKYVGGLVDQRKE